MNSLLASSAQDYASRGLCIFPCKPGGKAPATPHGFLDATSDPTQVEVWWGRNPRFNIGMPVPYGYLVLDVDDPAALGRLVAEGLDLPATVTAKTPRAFHYWYSLPAGLELRPGVGVLGLGIDLRVAGSYVVVAPSVVEGRTYRWLVPLHFDRIAPAPDALLQRLMTQRRVGYSDERTADFPRGARIRDRVDPMELLLNGVREGQRNSQLFRALCALRRKGAPIEVLKEYAENFAVRCTPPLPLAEARLVASSASKYEPADGVGL